VLGVAVDGRGRVFAACQDAGVHVWDGETVSQVAGGFTFANYPAFGADGTLYVSDSGSWSRGDGSIRADGEVFSRDAPHFTNGLAVTPDGRWLWVAESYRPRVGRIDLRSGAYEVVVALDGCVPDGLAFTADGGCLVACYRPDHVHHLSASGELSIVLEDAQGTLLGAPTNVCFAGAGLESIVSANLGRWHLTLIEESGLRGVPLHAP
jgi:gluconolactonase